MTTQEIIKELRKIIRKSLYSKEEEKGLRFHLYEHLWTYSRHKKASDCVQLGDIVTLGDMDDYDRLPVVDRSGREIGLINYNGPLLMEIMESDDFSVSEFKICYAQNQPNRRKTRDLHISFRITVLNTKKKVKISNDPVYEEIDIDQFVPAKASNDMLSCLDETNKIAVRGLKKEVEEFIEWLDGEEGKEHFGKIDMYHRRSITPEVEELLFLYPFQNFYEWTVEMIEMFPNLKMTGVINGSRVSCWFSSSGAPYITGAEDFRQERGLNWGAFINFDKWERFPFREEWEDNNNYVTERNGKYFRCIIDAQ